jgi:hypothetical protein
MGANDPIVNRIIKFNTLATPSVVTIPSDIFLLVLFFIRQISPVRNLSGSRC